LYFRFCNIAQKQQLQEVISSAVGKEGANYSGTGTGTGVSDKSQKSSDTASGRSDTYTLYGVVNHIGRFVLLLFMFLFFILFFQSNILCRCVVFTLVGIALLDKLHNSVCYLCVLMCIYVRVYVLLLC
jgi:hypothetical protein